MAMCVGLAGIGDVDELHAVLPLAKETDAAGHVDTGGELAAVISRKVFGMGAVAAIHRGHLPFAGADEDYAVLNGELADEHLSRQIEMSQFARMQRIRGGIEDEKPVSGARIEPRTLNSYGMSPGWPGRDRHRLAKDIASLQLSVPAEVNAASAAIPMLVTMFVIELTSTYGLTSFQRE